MAPRNTLVRKALKSTIESLFERAKARLLGRFYNGPKLFVQVVRDFGVDNSLEGTFRHTLMHNIGTGSRPDEFTLEAHAEESDAILDSLKAKVYRDSLQAIKERDTDKLRDIFENAKNHMEMIVATETRRSQSLAEDEAVVQVAASRGIQNPNVFFVGVLDDKTCKHCKAMYHCKSNTKIPRVLKFDQILTGTYFKPKNWDGVTVYNAPLHPFCRHSKTLLIPGFGFDENGHVQFIGQGYDEYQVQKARGDTD